MQIIATKQGDANFHLFEKLPKTLYDEQRLRQNGKENINATFFKMAYILVVDGEPKARVVLYENPNLIYEGKRAFCLGNYESVADEKIAVHLLDYASEQAKVLGAAYIIGPMNGSTWDDYRFSQSHDAPTFFMERYHHLYYNKHFEKAGFSTIETYFSSLNRPISYDLTAVLQGAKYFEEQGLIIRPIDVNDFENELKKLYPFITEAFKTNYLYTPISWTDFKTKYQAAKAIINPDFVRIGEDKNGKIVGFFFCVKDIFNTKEDSLILKTIARKSGEKWRGLGHVMGNEISRRAVSQGYQSFIHAFMKTEGYSTQASKNHSGNRYKNYVLYGKPIH